MTGRNRGLLGIVVLLAQVLTVSGGVLAQPQVRHEQLLRSLRPPTGSEAFSFAVVGDSRGGLPVLDRLLRQMEARNPLFVVHTGDLVGEATSRSFQQALDVLKRSSLPILTAMGNHDRAGEGPYRFLEAFGDPDYFFDIAGNRFIVLDNSKGLVTDSQLKWLENLLRTDKRKFVLAHEPPHYGYWVHAFSGNADRFMALVERYKTEFCIFSHIHAFDHVRHHGTHYVVSGGGGAPLYTFIPLMAPDGGHFYHYLLFDVSPGKVTFKVMKLEPAPLQSG